MNFERCIKCPGLRRMKYLDFRERINVYKIWKEKYACGAKDEKTFDLLVRIAN